MNFVYMLLLLTAVHMIDSSSTARTCDVFMPSERESKCILCHSRHSGYKREGRTRRPAIRDADPESDRTLFGQRCHSNSMRSSSRTLAGPCSVAAVAAAHDCVRPRGKQVLLQWQYHSFLLYIYSAYVTRLLSFISAVTFDGDHEGCTT